MSHFARGWEWYKSYQLLFIRSISEFLNLVPQGILVTAPKLQKDLLGTKDGTITIHDKFISLSSLLPGATRCHGTRIARGVPLPVYVNF